MPLKFYNFTKNILMRTIKVVAILVFALTIAACKKNKPSYTIEGDYKGNIQGIYQGNDTIVNSNYLVQIEALDKSTATVKGTLFTPFNVLVTPNGINIELVSPTDGLNQFLYEGDTKKLTFNYVNGDDFVTYVGTKTN